MVQVDQLINVDRVIRVARVVLDGQGGEVQRVQVVQYYNLRLKRQCIGVIVYVLRS